MSVSSNEQKEQPNHEVAESLGELPFMKVKSAQELEKLITILKTRMPQSSNVYNVTLMQPLFQDVLSIYTLYADETASTWIICIYIREDYGKEINISAPPLPTISNEVRDAFMNSTIFDWNQLYCFTSIQRPISSMLVELSCLKGNPTSVNPCKFYYFPTNEAKELIPANLAEESVEIKSLNSAEGVQFMYDNWSHSIEGSKKYIEKVVGRLESASVYVSGKPVSGILTSGNGLMGMLFTLDQFRNRNYARICMQELIRKLGNRDFIPCSIVQAENSASIGFHEKIGMKFSHPVDAIIYRG